MAEIISLNRVRKAKARAAKAVEADANRAKFGRTKAEKAADAAERVRIAAVLDGAKTE
ncbi:DUF4169 family protein [Sphingomonas donggukensis]|uniref:DUF4169 family protein n=2 Tax=Sphingomonas donggukensis TaxID=2949093 RepID=A0ABY4TXB5_9SPHN|nr:DUF4169 family protein [Sphingomonas donggukensis]URW77036.1 DUF4169 family protein [Sphingomonas donggukensis]